MDVLAQGAPPGIQESRACAVQGESTPLVEEFEFYIQNYPYGYQRRDYVIDIYVWYRYRSDITKAQYPNVVDIKNKLIEFIQNYPDKYQYWETLNKDVTQMLMAQYPVLTNLEVKFKIHPSAEFPFSRSTIVKRSQSCLESSAFQLLNQVLA